MTVTMETPGSASAEELQAYWRMPSLRATRDLALTLGLRRVKGRYPWYAIWAAEELAPPARKHWEDLKCPHLTATDLAEILGESARNARRRDTNKPDSSFPDPVALRRKPKLWRAAQVGAWAAGLPVPSYRAAPRVQSPKQPVAPVSTVDQSVPDVWDPIAEARLAANGGG